MMNSLRAFSEFTPNAIAANSPSQGRRKSLGSMGSTSLYKSVVSSSDNPKVSTAFLRLKSVYAMAISPGCLAFLTSSIQQSRSAGRRLFRSRNPPVRRSVRPPHRLATHMASAARDADHDSQDLRHVAEVILREINCEILSLQLEEAPVAPAGDAAVNDRHGRPVLLVEQL